MGLPQKAENRRVNNRKRVESVEVSEITSLSNYHVIARSGQIINASPSGFLLSIQRDELVPEELRKNLTLEPLHGCQVAMYLPQMNLDLDGTVVRSTHKGSGSFEIAMEFSEDVPQYWRECLIDLLPAPGEIQTSEESN